MTRLARFAAALALLAPGAALAEPTPVTVRMLAHDAKFVGEAMGGVAVTLTDARTGAQLAQGVIRGGTGDTGKLMSQPRVRGVQIAGPEAGAFTAVLEISAPTLVRLEARGPLGKGDAAITVSSMRWVLPGKAVDGDGWVVEAPGLVVEPSWTGRAGGGTLSAKVTLMCGCPITPGGMWNADRYEVLARLTGPDGKPAPVKALAYAGEASTFRADFAGLAKGRYRLLLTAYNPDTDNAGVAEQEIVVP
ncbi:hypothetical protein [Phenylobacterium sp.]|jgi:hypothetical protein|uniref:hypothetical protein n=1 Tax=Phenylobacterium sp. TaxID=1871053 RepID=UPI0035AF4F15